MTDISVTLYSVTETSVKVGLTIDELAREVDMSVRNLREWRALGLLPAPELRGRVGYYDADQVNRVKRIRQLHAEGFPLDLIRRLLETSGAAGDEVMSFARQLREPFRAEGATERAADALASLGLTDDEVRAATAELRAHADGIADLFHRMWLKHVWEPFLAAGEPPERWPEIRRTAGALQPLATDAVLAAFREAMDAKVQEGIAREVARAERQ
jgi:DNA-binding transcriptional MerR regulator